MFFITKCKTPSSNWTPRSKAASSAASWFTHQGRAAWTATQVVTHRQHLPAPAGAKPLVNQSVLLDSTKQYEETTSATRKEAPSLQFHIPEVHLSAAQLSALVPSASSRDLHSPFWELLYPLEALQSLQPASDLVLLVPNFCWALGLKLAFFPFKEIKRN